MDYSAWYKSALIVVTADNMVDPFGTLRAETLACTGTTEGLVIQAVTIVAGAVYTASVWLRAGSMGWAYLQFSNPTQANGARCFVNLNSGALGAVVALGSGTVVATAVRGSGSWVRLSLTLSIDASTTDGYFIVVPCNANNSVEQTPGGTIYAGGAQVELGGLTDYIMTAEAPVTRTQSIAIPIAPMIRRSPANGAAIVTAGPTAVWMLTADRTPLEFASGLLASGSIDIEEALV